MYDLLFVHDLFISIGCETEVFLCLALALWFSNQLLELSTVDRHASQGKITLHSSATCCWDTPNNYTFVHSDTDRTSIVLCREVLCHDKLIYRYIVAALKCSG